MKRMKGGGAPKAVNLVEAALDHHRAGRFAEAEALYRKVLAKDARHADSLHLLGHIHKQKGEMAQAAVLIRKAIAVRPEPIFFFSLGHTLVQLQRTGEALDAYRTAVILRPDYAEVWCDLGVTLTERGQPQQAIAALRRSLALNDGVPEPHFGLGVVLRRQGHPEEAAACYRAALRLRPDLPQAQANLGLALVDLGRTEEGMAASRAAIAMDPYLTEAYSNLGVALATQVRFDEALALYRTALCLRPEFVDAHSNMGFALTGLGRVDAGVVCGRRALTLVPNYWQAHCNLSMALLLRGDFLQGWEEYEWRWYKSHRGEMRFTEPQWAGEDISGKTILLYAEQGLGDTVQFIRYVPEVVTRAKKVIVEIPASLRHLLRWLEGVTVVFSGAELPPFDVQCPLLSLPRAFGTRIDTVPATVPYLAAEPERVAVWRERLAGGEGFRIGVVWQGKPGEIDQGRSYPLACLAPAARLPGVRLISLQKNFGLEQLDSLPEGMRVEILGPDFDEGPDAFIDTCAVMMALDLIITSDTSIAHIAGALGRPVWLAAKFVPDWRWLIAGEECPWYPTMRLFRQEVRGEWNGVFVRMAVRLQALLSARPEEDAIPMPTPVARPASAPAAVILPSHVAEVRGRHGTIRHFRGDLFIGKSLSLYGEWAEAEADLCVGLLRPGDVVVEAGANVGSHTLALAHRLAPGGTLHAFEPQPGVFELLRGTVAANGLDGVLLHQAALGAVAGHVRVAGIDYAGTGNFGGIAFDAEKGAEVPVVTIDGLGLERLRLLKANVNGAELEVVQGAGDTIRRCRPLLYLKNDWPDRSAALIGHIQALGYRLWWHPTPLFNPANAFGNSENVFERFVTVSLLCIPSDRDGVVVGLREILSPTESWGGH